MNITPFIQLLIREGCDPSGEAKTLFDCQTNGYGIQVKSDEWFGYRVLHYLTATTGSLRIDTARLYIGKRTNEFAWDELNAWNYEKGNLGYYISCNKFELSGLSDTYCFGLYNALVFFCCLAHDVTYKRFPLIAKGVNLGFMDQDQRQYFDANGLPTGKWAP